MAYVECRECGLRLNAAIGFVSDHCPRCLAREGRRVALEPSTTQTPRRFERARKLAEIELREAGLTPESSQP